MAKHSSIMGLATSMGLASLHSAITLWYRLPMLATAGTPHGNSRHGPEMSRMVSEKTSAAVEGFFDAQKEMLRLTGAAMTGRLDFEKASDAAASIAAAGMRPAFRTVKANSRRLSRSR